MMSEREITHLRALGIGPCLNAYLGFTCTLRSDHTSAHEALGPKGETANWPLDKMAWDLSAQIERAADYKLSPMPIFAVAIARDDFLYDSDGVPIGINEAACTIAECMRKSIKAADEKEAVQPFVAREAMTPWEFIANKNKALTRVVSYRSVGDAIMTLLRGMEGYARDTDVDIDEVEVAQAEWHGRKLVIDFKTDPERDYWVP